MVCRPNVVEIGVMKFLPFSIVYVLCLTILSCEERKSCDLSGKKDGDDLILDCVCPESNLEQWTGLYRLKIDRRSGTEVNAYVTLYPSRLNWVQVLTKEDQITNLKAGRVKVSLRLLRAAMSEYQYVCHVDGHDADQDYYIRTVYYYELPSTRRTFTTTTVTTTSNMAVQTFPTEVDNSLTLNSVRVVSNGVPHVYFYTTVGIGSAFLFLFGLTMIYVFQKKCKTPADSQSNASNSQCHDARDKLHCQHHKCKYLSLNAVSSAVEAGYMLRSANGNNLATMPHSDKEDHSQLLLDRCLVELPVICSTNDRYPLSPNCGTYSETVCSRMPSTTLLIFSTQSKVCKNIQEANCCRQSYGCHDVDCCDKVHHDEGGSRWNVAIHSSHPQRSSKDQQNQCRNSLPSSSVHLQSSSDNLPSLPTLRSSDCNRFEKTMGNDSGRSHTISGIHHERHSCKDLSTMDDRDISYCSTDGQHNQKKNCPQKRHGDNKAKTIIPDMGRFNFNVIHRHTRQTSASQPGKAGPHYLSSCSTSYSTPYITSKEITAPDVSSDVRPVSRSVDLMVSSENHAPSLDSRRSGDDTLMSSTDSLSREGNSLVVEDAPPSVESTTGSVVSAIGTVTSVVDLAVNAYCKTIQRQDPKILNRNTSEMDNKSSIVYSRDLSSPASKEYPSDSTSNASQSNSTFNISQFQSTEAEYFKSYDRRHDAARFCSAVGLSRITSV